MQNGIRYFDILHRFRDKFTCRGWFFFVENCQFFRFVFSTGYQGLIFFGITHKSINFQMLIISQLLVEILRSFRYKFKYYQHFKCKNAFGKELMLNILLDLKSDFATEPVQT